MGLVELSKSDTLRACGLLRRLYHPRNKVFGQGVRIPKTFPREALQWLKERGLAPNQRTTLSHAQAVRTIVEAQNEFSIADGARAFIASLGQGPPHGVFLEATLMAHRMPAHRLPPGCDPCRVCMMGKTEVVDVAERFLDWHTAGSGIPGDPTWVLHALEWLRLRPVRRLSADAKARIGAILHTLDNLAPTAPMTDAVQAVRALDVLDEDTRGHRARSVLETLAFAGVLDAPPHHGVADAWVDFSIRDTRPRKNVEVEAPLSFWRGSDGVHWGHARAVLGVSRSRAAKAQPPAAPQRTKPRPATPPKPPTPKRLKRRPAEAGDVWAVRVREDTYVLVYVWEIDLGSRPYAKVEYLDWLGPEPPMQVQEIGLRARYDGRWQTRVHGLHKTTGSALIATGMSPPRDERAAPTRTPAGAAKELAWLADACFPELTQR